MREETAEGLGNKFNTPDNYDDEQGGEKHDERRRKNEKAVDALYSALTCEWEDNGNIMAEAVRDYVTGTLVKLTGKTMLEVEATLERKIEEAQTRQVF